MCFSTWPIPSFSGNVHGWLCSCLAGVNFVRIPQTYLATLFLTLVIMAYWGSSGWYMQERKYPSTSQLTSFCFYRFAILAVKAKEISVNSFKTSDRWVRVWMRWYFQMITPTSVNIVRAIRNLFQIEVSRSSIHPSGIHKVNVCSARVCESFKWSL